MAKLQIIHPGVHAQNTHGLLDQTVATFVAFGRTLLNPCWYKAAETVHFCKCVRHEGPYVLSHILASGHIRITRILTASYSCKKTSSK